MKRIEQIGKLSPLAGVTATRTVLENHGLSTKYSLGQNFLINDDIIKKIADLSQLNKDDYILEVGPGIGTLTIALLTCADRVVSVERDGDLEEVLAEQLSSWSDKFTLVKKDALDLEQEDIEFDGKLPNKLVSNLPYAVAATIVLDYFQKYQSIDSATIMVQKEVADRMMAKPGTKDYGAYTIKLRLFTEPQGRFSVSPGNFFPPPRVESAVIRLNRTVRYKEDGTTLSHKECMAASFMADAAFASRRKTISNSCKTHFAAKNHEELIEKIPQLLEMGGIDPRRRGETLTVDEFAKLGCALLEISELQF